MSRFIRGVWVTLGARVASLFIGIASAVIIARALGPRSTRLNNPRKRLDGGEALYDLSHIGQIVRVMAKHSRDRVGPWDEYLPVLHR